MKKTDEKPQKDAKNTPNFDLGEIYDQCIQKNKDQPYGPLKQKIWTRINNQKLNNK